jgi:hypothetical protein
VHKVGRNRIYVVCELEEADVGRLGHQQWNALDARIDAFECPLQFKKLQQEGEGWTARPQAPLCIRTVQTLRGIRGVAGLPSRVLRNRL